MSSTEPRVTEFGIDGALVPSNSKTTMGRIIPPTRHLTPPDSASSHLTFRLRSTMPAPG